jgi:lycopene cyclase domain-containing protein
VITYLLLSLAVLVPVAAVSILVLRRAGRGTMLAALAALAVLLVLTAVFDSVLVGTGIVAYDRSRILGARIGAAPVEDFAYPIAAALALPALWHLLRRRRG